ncbi:MAG TPA: polyhydroxyalkanoic acid system family protein [Noviherbaspirillum sp.]|jgi:putative polyhydroxyalkanoate system protein|uniref:polyhydroxyalkanoic acid system family protein n=1 Tax=Noviherbaspirillum sp. TaxID=1926288 RepID=UPI002DDD31DB|nr:polyhydroxyalkanoic acid system family protein [Noviherbaspirillum sp.]HEV2610074.1 polyhydroxyalkanoic acid system family protein [Noviherbaspirillum sp.]
MADIIVCQTHKLPRNMAKAAAQKVADQMSQEYDMASEWDGDVLVFKRTGVSGTLALLDNEAQLQIKLGFLFKGFASTIESKVTEKMKRVFSSKV